MAAPDGLSGSFGEALRREHGDIAVGVRGQLLALYGTGGTSIGWLAATSSDGWAYVATNKSMAQPLVYGPYPSDPDAIEIDIPTTTTGVMTAGLVGATVYVGFYIYDSSNPWKLDDEGHLVVAGSGLFAGRKMSYMDSEPTNWLYAGEGDGLTAVTCQWQSPDAG